MKLSKIKPNPDNPRIIRDDKFRKLVKSINDFPEMMSKRPIVVDEDGMILGGNMRWRALREIYGKNGEIPDEWVSVAEGWSEEKKREFVIKDNSQFGEYDWDMLANQWDAADLSEWGVDFPQDWANPTGEDDEDAIARKEQEFKERMAAGEISEEDEEYQEFLEKFKLKKTTDDCYTPDMVYDAVASWVMSQYDIKLKDFVRPFYPGADYKNYTYPKGCVVVDNPPFSILAEIIDWYNSKGIKYFLFGPQLTLLGTAANRCSVFAVGVRITYANGANVNTSFATNMEPEDIVLRADARLYKMVNDANLENLKQTRKEMPRYSYPKHVIMSPLMHQFSRYGIDFVIKKDECYPIAALDAQKEEKASIYNKGYLVSDRIVAEREKAEREKAITWQLSDRERAIIAKLSKND